MEKEITIPIKNNKKLVDFFKDLLEEKEGYYFFNNQNFVVLNEEKFLKLVKQKENITNEEIFNLRQLINIEIGKRIKQFCDDHKCEAKNVILSVNGNEAPLLFENNNFIFNEKCLKIELKE